MTAPPSDIVSPPGSPTEGWPDIAARIWDMKYRLKAPDGAPVDQTVADTWRRVARALAAGERDPERWADAFYGALEGFGFLPAGRILAGAGTGRAVTLFNCFVMGTIPDDMGGIFAHLREAALTLQQGGGIGYDFSTLRPQGAPVRGVGADASGPLSFMDVWDAMCRTIMSAGSRRGAMMACLRCDHPDIEAFVAAKADPARLRMFNLSVLVTDAFMAAVKADADWPLVFSGTVFRTIRARALWDKITRATYAYAEPGVIFIDRVNRASNLAYCETIAATNPCVPADTWVLTAAGPRQVAELVGRPSVLIVDGAPAATGPQGFFRTGRKPLVSVTTAEGHRLKLTADHLVRVARVVTRWRTEEEWCAAGALKPGDLVRLNDHRALAGWHGAHGEAEGYLLGLLLGDGTLKDDKAVISVWRSAAAVNGAPGDDWPVGVMDAALRSAQALPHRSDFSGWMEVSGRNERRLVLAAVRDLALDLGMAPGRKAITPAMEQASSAFCIALLRGFFDCDGSVQGDQAKGVSIRLAQSDIGRLEAVQRMLLRFGIASSIYRDRRPAGERSLPDGRGGARPYRTLAQHELVVARSNVERFAAAIGFADEDKSRRLAAAIKAYRRAPNRERFLAEVAAVEPAGEAEVFDVAVPGRNAFDANGLYVHNCGEQPLPPYGACLLGSVNLAALVRDPFEPSARLDLDRLGALVPLAVRMLDNAIDASRFPLEAQAAEARAKRRMGLGVTGLADALIMCGLRYDSPEAAAAVRQWLGHLRGAAYAASAALAREKGAFPAFDARRYLAGSGLAWLPPALREAIARDGIRNALLTSIAPTGTISLLAGNLSSGIEPVFSVAHERTVLMPDGTRQVERVMDYAAALWRRRRSEAPLPDAFVAAAALPPQAHVRMQAAAQEFIDSSISKTINCPEGIGFDAFKDVYQHAYDSGCKGCTTYRPNPVTGAVLAVAGKADEPAPRAMPGNEPRAMPGNEPRATPGKEIARDAARDVPKDGPRDGVVYMTQPLQRPEALPGQTYKLKWPDSDHALYVTVNDVVQDGRRRPFEIFINSKNMEHYAWTVALTRMISAVFRRGGDVSFVVEELKAVFDPRGGAWMEGAYVPSLLAAIGGVIERHMVEIGFLPGRAPSPQAEAAVAVAGERVARQPEPGLLPVPRQCPACGAAALQRIEGCDRCLACGFSRCG